MENHAQTPSITAVPEASRTLFIVTLVVMTVSLIACPIIVAQSIKGLTRTLFNMDVATPAITLLYIRLGIVLIQYWYLWLAISLVLVALTLLWEFGFPGKRRWLSIMLSLTVSVLCWLVSAGAKYAVIIPLRSTITE